jgi:serine/threonine protein kinase
MKKNTLRHAAGIVLSMCCCLLFTIGCQNKIDAIGMKNERYTGSTMRAYHVVEPTLQQIVEIKNKQEALAHGIKYLNALNCETRDYVKQSELIMHQLHILFDKTETAYQPWVRYFDVFNKVCSISLMRGDATKQERREYSDSTYKLIEKCLLKENTDVNNLDWRIIKKILAIGKFLPSEIIESINKEMLLDNFKAQIDKALKVLLWRSDKSKELTKRILIDLQKCCNSQKPKQREQLLNAIIVGRLDKSKFKDEEKNKFLTHSLILGEDGGLYALINTLNEETWQILETVADRSYIEDKQVKGEKGNVNKNKIVLGAGGFGKVRFALSLFDTKANSCDVICIKKTKSYGQLDALHKIQAITDGTIDDYFTDTVAKVIYSPAILDMALISDFNLKANHQKGYIMMEVLPKNTGTKVFADKKCQVWEYQKPYCISLLQGLLELMKQGIVMTDLKPDNTLYDTDTYKTTIIDLGGTVQVKDLQNFDAVRTSFQFTEEFTAPELIKAFYDRKGIVDLEKALSYSFGKVLEAITKDGTDYEDFEEISGLTSLFTHVNPTERISIADAKEIITNMGGKEYEPNIFKRYVNKIQERLKSKQNSSIGINEDIELTEQLYIPLNATTQNPEIYKSLPTKDLFKEIDKFLNSKDSQVMLLLGAAGSGKSITLQQKFIEAIYNWNGEKSLPIYFNLATNIELDAILRSLDQELKTNIRDNLKENSVILFIDSFDEGLGIEHKKKELINSYIKHDLFGNIKDNVKILVACRVDYLKNEDDDRWFKPEGKTYEAFTKLYITPINYNGNAEFDDYIARWCKTINSEYGFKEFIEKLNKSGLKNDIDTGYLFYMTLAVLNDEHTHSKEMSNRHYVYQRYVDNYIDDKIKKFNPEQIKEIEDSFYKEDHDNKVEIENDQKLGLKENLYELGKYIASVLHIKAEFRVKDSDALFESFGYRNSKLFQYQTIQYLLKILPLKIELKQIGRKYEIEQEVKIGFAHNAIKNYFFVKELEDRLGADKIYYNK